MKEVIPPQVVKEGGTSSSSCDGAGVEGCEVGGAGAESAVAVARMTTRAVGGGACDPLAAAARVRGIGCKPCLVVSGGVDNS